MVITRAHLAWALSKRGEWGSLSQDIMAIRDPRHRATEHSRGRPPVVSHVLGTGSGHRLSEREAVSQGHERRCSDLENLDSRFGIGVFPFIHEETPHPYPKPVSHNPK